MHTLCTMEPVAGFNGQGGQDRLHRGETEPSGLSRCRGEEYLGQRGSQLKARRSMPAV